MGKIVKSEPGQVGIEGAPPYLLPDELSHDFISALLINGPGEDNFVGEIARHFTKDDKLRLRQTAKELGGETWRQYCREAAKWAPLINVDNEWHLDDFTIVYEAEIGSWYADKVIVANSNIRFVQSVRGLYTFPEFHWIYSQNIVEHLDEYQNKQRDHISDVKEHITATMVKKRFLVSDTAQDGAIVKETFAGLDSIPPEEWLLPPGKVFISVDYG